MLGFHLYLGLTNTIWSQGTSRMNVKETLFVVAVIFRGCSCRWVIFNICVMMITIKTNPVNMFKVKADLVEWFAMWQIKIAVNRSYNRSAEIYILSSKIIMIVWCVHVDLHSIMIVAKDDRFQVLSTLPKIIVFKMGWMPSIHSVEKIRSATYKNGDLDAVNKT